MERCKKCKKCGCELIIYKTVKEVVGDVEKERTVYICRNKNCPVNEIIE